MLRFIWGLDRMNRPKIDYARLAHRPAAPGPRPESGADVGRFLEQAA